MDTDPEVKSTLFTKLESNESHGLADLKGVLKGAFGELGVPKEESKEANLLSNDEPNGDCCGGDGVNA